MAYGKKARPVSARLAVHRFDPNMGGEAAPVKSTDIEEGPVDFEAISEKLRNTS
jgi:hypothetical protein